MPLTNISMVKLRLTRTPIRPPTRQPAFPAAGEAPEQSGGRTAHHRGQSIQHVGPDVRLKGGLVGEIDDLE